MVCQTRSKARQQAEQQNIRQTRSSLKQQETTDTIPDVIYLRTKRRVTKRPVRAAAGNTKRRARKRTKKPNSPVVRVPTTFSHLPTEIRLMIWEEFIRTPRIIHIDVLHAPTQAARGYTCCFQSHGLNGNLNLLQVKSDQVCPLVGVNRESRYVALKGPFIHFKVQIPVMKTKRFQLDTWITRTFSIRSHDIVFLDNSGSQPFTTIRFHESMSSIANIMIDLDVSDINYTSIDAIPRWKAMFTMGKRLIENIENGDCLQNIYCLMRDRTYTTTDKAQPYDLDDIQEMTPERSSQFPRERREDLLRWLQEFHIFPRTLDNSSTWLIEDLTAVRAVWKNVVWEGEQKEGETHLL